MIKLSPYHEIFYNEWKLNPQRSDYNVVIDHDLWGTFDPVRLKQALQRLSRDYFLLQSCIGENREGSYWIERPEISIGFDYIETPQTEATLLTYVKAPFDLETGPLLRVRLVKTTEQHFRLIMVFHHLIIDGGKVSFIVDAITHYYNNPQYQYDLSITEQCHRLNKLNQRLEQVLSENSDSHIKFWREQLDNLSGPDIRFLKKTHSTCESKLQENPIGERHFSIDPIVSKRLTVLKKQYKITPYLLSQAVFALLLHRYTGQDRFGLHYLVAISEGAEFIYGAHVSPIIAPYEFSSSMRIIDVLENTRDFVKKMKVGKHHSFPVQRLVGFPHNNFSTISFIQTDLRNQTFAFEGISKTTLNPNLRIDCSAKLLFAYEYFAGTYRYRVMYAKHHIDDVLLENFINSYQELFAEISADLIEQKTEKHLSDYWQTTRNWTPQFNNPYAAYPTHHTLHQLFETQVSKTPDQIALVYENKQLTYRELNESANRLAHMLTNTHAIEPDDLISLCLDRSHKIVVAMLAVLKSGAAYVPIDPNYPDNRIQYFFSDTQSKCVLTEQRHEARLTSLTGQKKNFVIAIDTEQSNSILNKQPTHNTQTLTTPTNLAYVIYTSGTTGQPKGVMIEHHNVVNLVHVQADLLQLSTRDKSAAVYRNYLGFANYVFDAHVWEFFVTLSYGHCLHLMSDDLRKEIVQLSDYIKSHRIDIATLPPILLEKSHLLPLKTLIVAGEKGEQSIVEQYLANGIQVINAYGPTETTVCATLHPYKKNDIVTNIGKPLSNVSVYVLDRQHNLLPVSAIGELHIGGSGLARGYLNQPRLTAEKFISNPFQTEIERKHHRNSRLYKTGDLVRQLPSGDLEYLERIDDQVKIRGMRVELAEIENQLACYPGIEHTVVKKQAGAEKLLLAYYVSQAPFKENELHKYLATHLPLYMVPHAFIHLDALPITPNGKLDKDALPCAPSIAERNYAAPRNHLEKTVCAEFARVLDLPERAVGIQHNFFELGGDSLRAIQLAVKLGRHIKINVSHIFELKTPEKLIQHLPVVAGNLGSHIEHIKAMYINTIPFTLQDLSVKEHSPLENKQTQYHREVNKCTLSRKTKKIAKVLLTGATGHLGCNLLEKLLTETNYDLFLLVRVDAYKSAYEKLSHKFRHYSGSDLFPKYQNRITLFAADIEKPILGLSTHDYHLLVSQVDSVIHCAALIKHQGHYEEFYRANVLATKHLLELTKVTKTQDFHYVSTVSVLLWGYVPGENEYLFNEEDDASKLIRGKNYYVQTKYQAENLVFQYRKQGMHCSVYRVGNLGMHSTTGVIQENSQENLFFNHIKAMLDFGIVPTEIAKLEMSPVDCTALAIIRLFDKVGTSNTVHHVFNPYPCDFIDLFHHFPNLSVRQGNLDEFIKKILKRVEMSTSQEVLHLFMIYQIWLQEVDSLFHTKIRVLQERTAAYLSQLNFNWPIVTPSMLHNFINKANTFSKHPLSSKRRSMTTQQNQKEDIFESLKKISNFFPGPMYWVGLDSTVLGVNKLGLKIFELSEEDCLVGKTPYDLYPCSMADKIVMHNNEIMQTGKVLVQEESIRGFEGKNWSFSAVKAPLKNEEGNIVGLIGTSVELSNGKEKLLQELKKITDLIPAPVYWTTSDSTVLGVNEYGLKTIGMTFDNFVNKTPYDLYPREMADKIVCHNNEVIKTGTILSQEETIKDAQGRVKHFIAVKSPLKDIDGDILGLIGTSIEITAQKEAERCQREAQERAELLNLEMERERQQNAMLQLEKKAQQFLAEQQAKFNTIVDETVHDIRNPLSVINSMLSACHELPEEKLTRLRQSLNNALNILYNLEGHRTKRSTSTSTGVESRQDLLIADYVDEIVDEKKYQYINQPIDFELDVTNAAKTAHVDCQSSQLRRALSNLINNAIDALPENRNGVIKIVVDANEKWVEITIRDNGIGMMPEAIQKIHQRISFTENKLHGHGLGLQQVGEMLDYNRGKMEIESTLGEGTTFHLFFPRSAPPNWLAQEIVLQTDTIVLILEDDTFLHQTWEYVLGQFVRRYPTLQLKCFVHGEELLCFVQALSDEERVRVLLLADYELTYQIQNGLQIIIASQINNAILITGHSSNAEVRKAALERGINLLPKQFIDKVTIRLGSDPYSSAANQQQTFVNE